MFELAYSESAVQPWLCENCLTQFFSVLCSRNKFKQAIEKENWNSPTVKRENVCQIIWHLLIIGSFLYLSLSFLTHILTPPPVYLTCNPLTYGFLNSVSYFFLQDEEWSLLSRLIYFNNILIITQLILRVNCTKYSLSSLFLDITSSYSFGFFLLRIPLR